MKNSDVNVCQSIENKINETDSILEVDRLDSELRILDWILYQVSSYEIKLKN